MIRAMITEPLAPLPGSWSVRLAAPLLAASCFFVRSGAGQTAAVIAGRELEG